MVHTRETRTSASEVKFVIDRALAPRIADWARTHLSADPHGHGPHGDEYETSSLYFDTRHLDVFRRRGSYGRAKYRVRRYNEADTVFLERKLRKPGMLVKRRTVADLDSLPRLEQSVVQPDGQARAGERFERRLRIRRLHPVCQLSYHRIARAIASGTGVARLTLDRDLRVAPITAASLDAAEGFPVLAHRAVLDLKYPGGLPAIVRQLVEQFALEPCTASKHRHGMAVLGHEPAAAGDATADDDGRATYA